MHRLRATFWKYSLLCVSVVLLTNLHSLAQSDLAPELRANIDETVRKVLATTGVPGASLAVVKDGKIAYLQAYGDARLEPHTLASPEMRYSIGSISKQFTAAAILMLAEEGKLALDDPVSKYISGLTRGNEVTIRQLLSHTSGYGLLAAGLCDAHDVETSHARSDSRSLGPYPAGFRPRHEVAVQQH